MHFVVAQNAVSLFGQFESDNTVWLIRHTVTSKTVAMFGYFGVSDV